MQLAKFFHMPLDAILIAHSDFQATPARGDGPRQNGRDPESGHTVHSPRPYAKIHSLVFRLDSIVSLSHFI